MAIGSIVLSVLQISPLVFIVSFRLASIRYPRWWTLIVKDEIDDGDEARAGNFEMYTIFTFDWFQATFGLSGSLIYTGLFVLYTANQPAIIYPCLFTGVATSLLLSGIVVPWGVHQWFKRQNPEPYCRFFYNERLRFAGVAEERVQNIVSGEFFHRKVSVGNLTVLSELLLLVTVGAMLLGKPFFTN